MNNILKNLNNILKNEINIKILTNNIDNQIIDKTKDDLFDPLYNIKCLLDDEIYMKTCDKTVYK